MTNRVKNILGIKYPIIQGPMYWITDANFVAAVSNAGGLGVLGPNAGYRQITDNPDETGNRMREQIRKVRELTDKPFGVNVGSVADLTFTTPIIKVMIEEKVPVALVSGGLRPEIISELKKSNITVVYRDITPTIENAKAAENAGVDILVATGFDEGGTLPTRPVGTFTIVPMIADAVSIPVVAAGGITDIRGVRAAFALGAEGVLAGSVFIPTEENPASKVAKDLIVDSTADDMITFRSLPGFARVIKNNKIAADLWEMEKDSAKPEELYAKTGKLRLGFLEGDFDGGSIAVGLGITNIKEILPVKVVVEDLMQDFVS